MAINSQYSAEIPIAWSFLDFEVNGNGAEDGRYTIRINAITGDEIAWIKSLGQNLAGQ